MDANLVNWASLVKGILDKSGFGNYWVYQYVGNETQFLTKLKQRLYDMYLQEWAGEVAGTSSNRIYKSIKDSLYFENYLNMNNKSLRISITRIRLSSHLFRVERGRWGPTRINVECRVCSLCNVVEDEFHCLIECPRYENERNGCLPERIRIRPSETNFIRFIKSLKEPDYINLGLLCMRVMKEHRKYV